ncbi:MAG: hypothetical protein WDM78_07295 [Puia sp.]
MLSMMGMFKYTAGKDFTDQIRFGYDQGFRAIEDNGMMDRLPGGSGENWEPAH